MLWSEVLVALDQDDLHTMYSHKLRNHLPPLGKRPIKMNLGESKIHGIYTFDPRMVRCAGSTLRMCRWWSLVEFDSLGEEVGAKIFGRKLPTLVWSTRLDTAVQLLLDMIDVIGKSLSNLYFLPIRQWDCLRRSIILDHLGAD
jgi:hypothetical protein